MAHRALIIAIERYPQMTGGIAGTLPGTLAAGEAFRDWLSRKWDAEAVPPGSRQLLMCSEPQVPGGTPATADAIRAALRQLRTDGQNATEALYVFFSGHGFAFSDARHDVMDYVLASDCQSPALSPGACLPLDHLVTWLRDHLGPGRHYYFVDACRNVLDVNSADPGSLGLTRDQGATGEPSTFVLQSTHQGAVAAVSTEFPAALMGGLRGAGRAKVYVDATPDAMFVHYGSLREHVKAAMRRQKAMSRTTGDVSESDALLFTLRPIPSVQCRVGISGAAAAAGDAILVRRERGPAAQRVVERRPIAGPTTVLSLEPDRYSIGVEMAGQSMVPAGMVAVDVFDDVDAPAFVASAGGPMPLPAPAPAVPVPHGRVPQAPAPAGAGPEDDLDADDAVPKTTARRPRAMWDVSLPHRGIAANFPHDDQTIDFSESLGGVHDADLGVWLAILGAGRIMPQRTGDYSKIGPLPLYDFEHEAAGAAPVYVLAALDDPSALRISVSDGTTPQWQPAIPVTGMEGVAHLHVPGAPGAKLVSLHVPGQPTRTLASLTSANRVTLIAVTAASDGTLQVWQYLLPIGHLIDHLPPAVRDHVRSRSNALDDIRGLAVAGRAFRQRRDLASEMRDDQLQELLHAKWIDPIGSSLVAYQALRRGARDLVGVVAANLRDAFPELPDGHALATLAALPGAAPRGVPLFIDGLRAFPDDDALLPFPERLLDMSGPWTAWQRAVPSSPTTP